MAALAGPPYRFHGQCIHNVRRQPGKESTMPFTRLVSGLPGERQRAALVGLGHERGVGRAGARKASQPGPLRVERRLRLRLVRLPQQ